MCDSNNLLHPDTVRKYRETGVIEANWDGTDVDLKRLLGDDPPIPQHQDTADKTEYEDGDDIAEIVRENDDANETGN